MTTAEIDFLKSMVDESKKNNGQTALMYLSTWANGERLEKVREVRGPNEKDQHARAITKTHYGTDCGPNQIGRAHV